MKKEPKFQTEEEFIDHILTYKPIRNTNNFKFFSLETVNPSHQFIISNSLSLQL